MITAILITFFVIAGIVATIGILAEIEWLYRIGVRIVYGGIVAFIVMALVSAWIRALT